MLTVKWEDPATDLLKHIIEGISILPVEQAFNNLFRSGRANTNLEKQNPYQVASFAENVFMSQQNEIFGLCFNLVSRTK